MNPVISVCIPTYNGAKYFRECLDSILAQTLTEFELLIVDDHSSDDTLKIAQEYADRDARIRVTKNERNLGLVGNWNRCIELAQGEWIKFVFQDDLIAEKCLEKMMFFKDSGIPIVCCYRNFLYEDGTSELIQNYYNSLPDVAKLFPDSNIVSADNFCEEVFKNIGLNIVGEPTAVILHRSLFYKFGVFNLNLVQLCDWEFWTRVISNTGFAYIDESLATFRVHNGSTSAINADKRWYRKDVLDPLLIVHDFALHPTYANLRRYAFNRSFQINMIKVLSWLAYKAKMTARKHSNHSANDNQNLIEEWENVVKLYPSLATFSNQNFFKHSIKYWLLKLNLK